MPLSASEKLFIKDMLLRPVYFAIYELENPWVVTFRWPGGELKYFLITAEGNLVDAEENSAWDYSFTFISSTLGGGLEGMSIPATI